MRKLKLTLMIGTILTAWNVQANCVTPPDCAGLGFTTDASKCSGTVLKCPWNLTKAACKETAPLPILYGDGTVSKEILSGKTPIGIVFDETNKLAIALNLINEDGNAISFANRTSMRWSNNLYDIPSMTNCLGSTPGESCDVDGRENTNKILACGEACGGTPAATAVNSFEPTGCSKDFCKKTKWFLPSEKDWMNIYTIVDLIKTSLRLVDGDALSLVGYSNWSSNEGDPNHAFMISMDLSPYGISYNKDWSAFVRPVIYYGEPKPEAPLPILYGDGTVSKEIISGKTPIGVVFDETNRLAVALTDVKQNGTAGSETMYWSNNSYDISALPSCQYSNGDASVDSCSVDGRSNTTLILNCGSSCGGTPAATAVNSYEPTGCTKDFCKKTKWFLPSMRDLAGMYSYKSQIEATLTLLNSAGAVSLGTKYYWSSTEYNNVSAWIFNMDDGYRHWAPKYGSTDYVRPVVKY